MLWSRLEKSSSLWNIHRETTVDALRGLEAPLDCHAEWQREVDELRELDLETEEDSDFAAGLLRKRPDGFAFNWGSKINLILELTRAYDWCATWHTDIMMDHVKTQRSLRDKLSGCLPAGWTVDKLPYRWGYAARSTSRPGGPHWSGSTSRAPKQQGS